MATSFAKKLYIVYCGFSDSNEEGMHKEGSFEFILNAGSADEVETVCRKRLASLHKDETVFTEGTKIFIYDVLEINELPTEGVIVNYASHTCEYSAITAMLLGPGDSRIVVHGVGDDPGTDAVHHEVMPFLVLGTDAVR